MEYPVFRGLQRPLELLGFQGRYITWAAMTAGGGIGCFIVGYVVAGFIAGLVGLTFTLGTGIVLIYVKQRKGLHSKRVEKGVFVFAHSRKM